MILVEFLRSDSRPRLPRRAQLGSTYRPEPQRVHHRHRPRAHRENIAQNAAHSRSRALKRLNKGRMIMRLDLERAAPTVPDIDDAGILSRPLEHQLAARRQPLQMDARRLVRAVLTPHHAENAQFCPRWF